MTKLTTTRPGGHRSFPEGINNAFEELRDDIYRAAERASGYHGLSDEEICRELRQIADEVERNLPKSGKLEAVK
jgi:hypothetical protein